MRVGEWGNQVNKRKSNHFFKKIFRFANFLFDFAEAYAMIEAE